MENVDYKLRLGILILILCFPLLSEAQYFGRNKPSYKSFRFDVVKTPNFEIYHNLTNDLLLKNFANRAEEWYLIHQRIFRDTFPNRNPIILYANHPDFQQTNAVSGSIGTTTGGVTESLKNRVIMPVAPTVAQTDHVLGHELVHAFQFNKLLRSDTAKRFSIGNLPLWMVEGMAEYYSIGCVDAHTAMWMRDALINDDFPTIRQLSNVSRYFPYRYGHAFFSMVGKTWGDSLIIPLFLEAARVGVDKALENILGYDSKTLSGMWKSAMENHFGLFIADTLEYIPGTKILSEKNAGRLNLSPSLSPDGKIIAFFSERDVLSLDLYLADAKSGKIKRKISSINRNFDIDDFSFIETSGTWSPDSRQFGFVVFRKGKNRLAIADVKRGRIIREIDFGDIVSFSNPEWSPCGRYVVFSGLVNGISDLYLFDFETGKTSRLTDSFYSEIHPDWSPDVQSIVFSAESVYNQKDSRKFSFSLNILNLESGEIRMLEVFPGADNLNPRFSADGNSVYFLSNADGFRNLYQYNLTSGNLFKLTNFRTGISGITHFSPAISVSRTTGNVAYTHYFKKNYEIYNAVPDEFRSEPIYKNLLDMGAATLPPLVHLADNVVDNLLYYRTDQKIIFPPDSFIQVPYRPRFKLDYISNTANIGITSGRYYNNNMGGSVNMIFSDIVGNNQLHSVLALNGEIYDFGGQVAYINQTRRIKWGATASHIPYRAGSMFMKLDSLTFKDKDGEYKMPVINLVLDYLRMFEDQISVFSFHTLSQTRRIEAGASSSWYYYRLDRYNNYIDNLGFNIGVKKERMPVPRGNNYQKIDLAYVHDNSFFGLTAPLRGQRSRYQIEKYFGAVGFLTGMADHRRYINLRPFTLATRLYHYGRYGKDSDTDVVLPIYLGYPWLIRGYENISVYNSGFSGSGMFNYSHLSGSKVLVGNVELRLPLTGPKRLSVFESKWLLSDLNLFFDSGVAWNRGEKVRFAWDPEDFDIRTPVFSAGTSLRINVLGALIVEPYYAIPFQNGGWKNRSFGVNFLPGW